MTRLPLAVRGVVAVLALSTAAAAHAADNPTAIRSGQTRLDLGAAAAGDRVALDLFDDVSLTGVIERARRQDRSLILSGVIEADRPGTFTIVKREGALAGIVRAPGLGVFRLRSTPGHELLVESIDEDLLPRCGNGPEHAVGGGGWVPIDGGPCDDGSVIDVMILYTPIARSAIGGTANMLAEIDLAVAVTNTAYTNSLIPMQINVVHTQEIDYDESSNYSGHLNRLTNPNDGFMDEAHDLRDQYDADMVDLLVNDGENCGIAWLMTQNTPAFEDSAFSVTTWYCASNLVLAHELGHNMGCCHAVGDGGGCFNSGLFSYSVGWRYFGNTGNQWRTVMAYSPGNRISYFSNPEVIVDGHPTGVVPGEINEAHNASTISQTKLTISQFRCSIPTCQAGRLHAADGAAGDVFGWSVGIDEDVAVVGAPFEGSAGSAYVFRHDRRAQMWVQETKLLASDGALSDDFGIAVATQGDLAIVGASGSDAAAAGAGAAYVFRYDGVGWSQETQLLASDAEAGDRFGISVAISGDVVVVGADGEDENGSEAGAAYVLRFDGSRWGQVAKLLASDGEAGDGFGRAVSASGDAIAVGAAGDDDVAEDAGAAYVFRDSGSAWDQEGKLASSEGAAADALGFSVAISGSHVVVGAHQDDEVAEGAGAAYVFRNAGDGWELQTKLTARDGSAFDAFGRAVAIDGNLAIIGAHNADGDGIDTGAVYLFRTDGTWDLEANIQASDHFAGDRFGYAVDLSGELAVAGAFSNDDLGASAGAVEILSGSTGYDCNNNGTVDVCDIEYGWSVDADLDGLPDECACPWDLDGDGTVATTDLLMLRSAWGMDPGGPPDFDGDGMVDSFDLLLLLGNWGPCG